MVGARINPPQRTSPYPRLARCNIGKPIDIAPPFSAAYSKRAERLWPSILPPTITISQASPVFSWELRNLCALALCRLLIIPMSILIWARPMKPCVPIVRPYSFMTLVCMAALILLNVLITLKIWSAPSDFSRRFDDI